MNFASMLFFVLAILLFAAAIIPGVTKKVPKWHLIPSGLAFWVLSSLVMVHAFALIPIMLFVAFLCFAIAASAEADARIANWPHVAVNLVPFGLFLWAFAEFLSTHDLPKV